MTHSLLKILLGIKLLSYIVFKIKYNFLILYFYFSSPKLSIVHFHAEWAEQCKPMDLVMEEIAKQETTVLYLL